MKSHEYQFEAREVIRLLAAPLIPLVVFALLLQFGAAAKILPQPRPAVDTDRTILFHQAEASRSPSDANLVLIGDSSCLMDVAAEQLEQQLDEGRRVLNLGTLSYLQLPSYAALLRQFVSANPGRLRTVVLLMHPEALRQVSPSEYHIAALEHFLNGTDFCDPSVSALGCWLGRDVFRGRIWARAMPIPLSGEYGRAYGFTSDLWRYLSEHRGSAFDPRTFDRAKAQGDAEYRLAKSLEQSCRAFKSAVPSGARLIVGMTPTPASFAPREFGPRYEQILREWSQWLSADATLADLPATLPDIQFASTTHLNRTGRRAFTERLAASLAPQLNRK